MNVRSVVKQMLIATHLWPLLRPRSFHAFCLGAAKSGTQSVAAMFRTKYRASHEPTFLELIRLMNGRDRGDVGEEDVRSFLRQRDRVFRLEMESSHPIAYFSDELACEFPAAKFIVTVRQPKAWLDSVFNQHLNVDLSERPTERSLRDLLYGRGNGGFSSGEAALEQHSLYPLDGYLSGWSEHYRRILRALPADRSIFVDTNDLRHCSGLFANFLGIPEGRVDITSAHVHKAPTKHGLLARLDNVMVDEKVNVWCSGLWGELEARMHHFPSSSKLGEA